MNKVYGATGRQDGLYKIGKNKWELIYGFGKDTEDDETGWNYRQRFSYIPSKDEIVSLLTAQINADTDEKILYGFTWAGKPVLVNAETQANITGVMANLPYLPKESFPLSFKLGTYPDGTPSFHSFESAEEFAQFSVAGVAYKSKCYADGWAAIKELDTLDFTVTL